ncbi:MAG: FRG domain-containing protein [Candidatus Poribacteria bacterium]|nr:FRG domain-containing protein [Candidatus Poribacteria bacterium]
MEPVEVSTLTEFIEWSSQFDFGQHIFRGVSKKSYKIHSSTYRLMLRQGLTDLNTLVSNDRMLIGEARQHGHDQKDGRRFSDLELLAELQHFGVPTCLIDFTYNSQVALWFACQQSTSDTQEDGKVAVLSYDDVTRFRKVTHDLLRENISYFFQEDTCYYWQPSHQNKRIITQQSVFVFGGRVLEIETDAECIVRESKKQEILTSLVNVSGITEAHIYPDIEGFVRIYTRDLSLRGLTVQEYLHLSNQEIQSAMEEIRYGHNQEAESAGLNIDTYPSSLDLAIAYCGRAIEMMTDGSTRADNLTIARAYYIRGLAYNLIGRNENNSAIADYSRAIELYPNYTMAYFNRGLIWIDQREWDNARTDFTKIQTLGVDLARYFNGFGGMQIFDSSIVAELPEDIMLLLNS